MSDRPVFVFHQSSSYSGAPMHAGEALIAGNWQPARFEGNTPDDGAREALHPWMVPTVDAVRINGTLYVNDMKPRSRA